MWSLRGAARLLCLSAATAALWGGAEAGAAETVTKTADSDDGKCDADCSLREAIKASAEGETITLPASTTPYEVLDINDSLVIEKDLTIAGAGARQTEVTAPGTLARPFTILSNLTDLPDVTIRDVSITGGDGFGAKYAGQGGGVLAAKGQTAISGPTVLLERVRVAGNTASVNSKAQAVGGGVTADGVGTTLTIRDSLIVGNMATGTGESQATGGGVATFASAAAHLENTTIVGNEARADSPTFQSSLGGGVVIGSGSSALHLTIVGNTAGRNDPTPVLGRGGGLVAAPTATVQNTIVSGNAADEAGTEDCVTPFTTQTLGGNVVPASCGPGPADRPTAAAGLEPIADNGGETDTMALQAGSPAIDAGVGCPPPTTDQRGAPRPSGAACDAGALEFEFAPSLGPGPFNAGAAKCRGRTASIVGTAGRDVLKGTKRADVIAGLDGDDIIRGRGGNDRICGFRGSDRIFGGRGRDVLIGAAGRDLLSGGAGRDLLVGGRGSDELRGGAGRDTLKGGAGQDLEKP